ncbi:Protease 4 [Buchnera aphidicola (Sipha maydis)]|uniref:signal peptide peptidase SppA n=1 Tax=Buchnera aphidicola TaxID=9 RepID=UPI0034645E6E
MKTISKTLTNFFLLIITCIRCIKNIFVNIFLAILFLISIFVVVHRFYFIKPNYLTSPGILRIDLHGKLKEDYYHISKYHILSSSHKKNHTSDELDPNSVFVLVDKMKNAILDPNVKGVLLDLKDFQGGSFASLSYFGKYLQKIHEAKKPIYVEAASYNQAQYYLASFADSIFLENHGSVDLEGISHKKFFLKNFLKLFEIHVHVFKEGKYKSAPDVLSEDKTPEDVKKFELKYINSLWNNYTLDISKNRNISQKLIFDYFLNQNYKKKILEEDLAQFACSCGLVDFVITKKTAEQIIHKKFSKFIKNENYPSISIYQYNKKIIEEQNKDSDKTIAVIVNNGALISDQREQNRINIDKTIEEIEFAKNNNDIKALILYINSPGGGVYESEKIRKEINNFKNTSKKPVIILMGGVAASGGYWISTAGDYIIADQSTITGSIGVFKIICTFEKCLKKLGINYDGVEIPNIPNKIDPTKELSPEAKKLIQQSIEKNYQKFLKIVSESRHLTIKQVEKIAQGKVWTGTQAKDNGLVDEIGDLDHAIDKAKNMIQTKSAHIIFLNTQQNNTNISDAHAISNEYIKKFIINIMKTYLSKDIFNQIKFDEKYTDIIYIINHPERRFIYFEK